jgi:hypothetical protein
VAIELPDELIALERSAWAEIQEGRLTVPTALAVHQGVADFVKQAVEAGGKVTRFEVEMALKKTVRHPELQAA